LNDPGFKFERSLEATTYNTSVLCQFNFDINKAILSSHPSQLSYGLEFKSSSELEDLLMDHPHWSQLKKLLDR
jgi:hypothetical protein